MLNEITVEMNDKPPSIDSNSSEDFHEKRKNGLDDIVNFSKNYLMSQKMHLLNII